MDGTSATLISPRTSPKLSLLGADKPLRTGTPIAAAIEDPLEADCFRTRSAQDLGGGGATGAAGVASTDDSGLTISSVGAIDSGSAFDLAEATESWRLFLAATGLAGIAGITGTTGIATRETFCCVGVCCVLTAGATAEDGVVGWVDMWSDGVSDGTVVGVSAGTSVAAWFVSSVVAPLVTGVTEVFS